MGEIKAGQIVNNYHILTHLGSGGASDVYKAQHTETGRIIAVKVLDFDQKRDEESIKRLQMEAVIAFRLKHPHIVPLYDYWHDEHGIWVAMPWMPGGSLREQIQQGGWSISRTTNLLKQIAGALTAAHKQSIIHRDMKPDNILFDTEGKAYLADFGVAKRLKAESITHPTVFVGSPAYLAPEQIRKEDITPRTDIYALAVTLHETLAGEHPFGYTLTKMQMVIRHLQDPLPSLRLSRPDVPEELAQVLLKATEKEPENRYQTAGEFAQAFYAAAGES